MIDAKTATWLKFDGIRNCGAAIDDQQPEDQHDRDEAQLALASDRGDQRSARRAAGVDGGGDRLSHRRHRPAPVHRRPHRGDVAGRREHDTFLGRPVARDLGGDPSLMQDEDPVGHRQDLGQVARDEDDRRGPDAASSEMIRWTSTLAPMSMPRVGSSRMSTVGPDASHLARTTFCWFPPDSAPTNWSTRSSER